MQKRNNPYMRFTVKEEDTLLSFVLKVMEGVSRSRAKAILSGGGIRVNNTIRKQFDEVLKKGDIVEISRAKPRAELRSKFVRVVYEDAHIIVIEKAVGILSMQAGTRSLCVKKILDNYFLQSKQRCKAHVVHRLDRDTSGLLVYAKTMEAEQILEHNWREIVTDRRYVALVSGQMEQDEGTVSSWLKDNSSYLTISTPEDPGGGKFAITHFRTKRRSEHYSLVELKLETGRKNQIRVHMKDLGHPVCGDIKYGNGDDPVHRLALHAFRLHFYHPILGDLMKFETEVPRSFLRAVSMDGKAQKSPEMLKAEHSE